MDVQNCPDPHQRAIWDGHCHPVRHEITAIWDRPARQATEQDLRKYPGRVLNAGSDRGVSARPQLRVRAGRVDIPIWKKHFYLRNAVPHVVGRARHQLLIGRIDGDRG